MHILKLFLPIFFVIVLKLDAQWLYQKIMPDNGLNDVCYVNEKLLWIAGDYGTILHSTDSGINWTRQNSNVSRTLGSIFFIDSLNGWASGDSGYILKTTNGGTTWLIKRGQPETYISSLFFINKNIGWASVSDYYTYGFEVGYILNTTDGGTSWKKLSLMVTPYSLQFFDADNGWCCDPFQGQILKTIDGGKSWTVKYSDYGNIKTIHFLNKDIGWAISRMDDQYLLKTTNGGNSWQKFAIPYSMPTDVFFIDELNGRITSLDGEITLTTDGGVSWKSERGYSNLAIWSLKFFNPTVGIAVGSQGTILQYCLEKKLSIISPLQGEVYNETNQLKIEWQSNLITKITIEISLDLGHTWKSITKNYDAYFNFYSLPLLSLTSDSCLIRITDADDSTFTATSGIFTIKPDYTVNLLSPNGGEIFEAETDEIIKFYAHKDQRINLLFSPDDRINWDSIIYNVLILQTGEQLYQWRIPNNISKKCRVKISDFSDPSNNDISDTSFTIEKKIGDNGYFPLSAGNKWFFYEGIVSGLYNRYATVVKDTVLSDQKIYAKIEWRGFFNNSDYSTTYLRQELGKIFEFPELLILDFKWEKGDTVNNPSLVVSNTGYRIAWRRNLKEYTIFTTTYDYHTFIDSIGFGTLSATTYHNWTPVYLAGCVIDGKPYGSIPTNVGDDESSSIVKEYFLYQNFPNPFNPTTTICYQLPKTGFVSLIVYDLLGKEVATLVNEEKLAGSYEVEFSGSSLPSGIYFYKLQTENYSSIKKMNMVK